jgi:hypothetical protein
VASLNYAAFDACIVVPVSSFGEYRPGFSLPGFLEGTTPAPPLSRPSPVGGFASLESRAEGGIPLEAGEDAGFRRIKDMENQNHKTTPWGAPQTTKEIASGIILYTTASHGGFWLSPERNEKYQNSKSWKLFAGTA